MKSSHLLYVFTLIILFLSCKNRSSVKYDLVEPKPSEAITIIPDSIKVEGDLGDFSVNRQSTIDSDGVQHITFNFSAEKPSELKPIFISMNFPSIDINGFWNPRITVDKVNFYSTGLDAKASRNAPILSYYNKNLQNRITIALSDALNKSEFWGYIKEEDVNFYPRIRLFDERMPKTTSYEITLRIDTRPLPYYETINDVASWWSTHSNYKPLHVPEEANEPMYSTWYSYHQSITA